MKTAVFQLNADGSVEKVGGFGSYGPTVKAANKSEAQAKFLAFAYRSAEHPPTVKVRNGAWQLVSEALDGTVSVESGTAERNMALCCAGAKTRKDVTDETAGFAYYASEEYQQNMMAA